MQKRKGMALISVIVVLSVVIIFTASISAIFSQDLKETVNQESQTKAYYLALSGIEMGEAALMTEYKASPSTLYIEAFKGPGNKKFVTHPTNPANYLSLGEGKIKIEMGNVKDGSGKIWIQIHSEGILDKDGKKEDLYKLIDPDNDIIRVMQKTGFTYMK